MDPLEQTVLQKAIAATVDLFKTRTDSEDWVRNIVEGSKTLTTPLQWTHFYTFLTNPNGYDESKVDINSTAGEEYNNEYTRTPYESCLEEVHYKNGPNETIIHVKNNSLYLDQDDEKKTDG